MNTFARASSRLACTRRLALPRATHRQHVIMSSATIQAPAAATAEVRLSCVAYPAPPPFWATCSGIYTRQGSAYHVTCCKKHQRGCADAQHASLHVWINIASDVAQACQSNCKPRCQACLPPLTAANNAAWCALTMRDALWKPPTMSLRDASPSPSTAQCCCSYAARQPTHCLSLSFPYKTAPIATEIHPMARLTAITTARGTPYRSTPSCCHLPQTCQSLQTCCQLRVCLQAYASLCSKLKELSSLNGISGLLQWDELVMMPPGAGAQCNCRSMRFCR